MRTTLSCSILVLTVAAAAHAQPPLERTTEMRPRIGADIGPGFGSPGYSATVAAAIHVRAGAQIDDTLAIYYQAGLLLATLVPASCSIPSCTSIVRPYVAYGLQTNSVMVEATIADRLQLAVGPSFAWGVASEWVGGIGWSSRVAYTFGGTGIGTRQGFSMGIQVEGVWLPSTQTVPVQGVFTIGWDTF